MTEPAPRRLTDLVLAALLGGLVSAVLAGGGIAWHMSGRDPAAVVGNDASVSATPTLDALDAVRCPRGLSKTVQVRGREDGFSRLDSEPAEVDPAMRQFGGFDDLAAGRPRAQTLRDFDDTGPDGMLIHHFDIPEGTVSGTLVLHARAAGAGAENDFIGLIPQQPYLSPAGAPKLASYTFAMADARANLVTTAQGELLAVPLAGFGPSAREPFPDILSHMASLSAKGKPARLTLEVVDDTAVDVAGLALCVEPDEERGVTFVELSDKPMGAEVSVLACSLDMTQNLCGPTQGDVACDQALPVACYRDGTASKPEGLKESFLNDATFVGGEVRATPPVPGERFQTLEDASRFCADRFGEGWRVLSYQEGGGAVVISRSRIPARTRLWIDIRDQPRARCWDRPERGRILTDTGP